jgi:signal transduction histidine kinase
LHDNLGQLLHVARVKLDALEHCLLPGASLSELNDLLSAASRQVRTLTSQLSPPILKRLGLAAALHWLADEMASQYGLSVDLMRSELAHTPNEAQVDMLFRTARELLINVVKHSGVRQASLSLGQDAGQTILTVADAGVGIGDLDRALNHTDGFGLASIRERITYLSGHMDIAPGVVAGVCITIRLPLSAPSSNRGSK